MENSKFGKIFICGTPIGNLGDISSRLAESLESADIIYSEDTRITSKLLTHLKIEKPIKRLDENIIDKHAPFVVDEAKAGSFIAYCTDAGMPGVSDPGLKLVDTALNEGVEVEVVPGPSALINAYVASGFTNQSFYFGGFLPKKENAKSEILIDASKLNAVLIFYESPKRLVETLKNVAEIFPDTSVSVCRELTKVHEEIVRGNSCDVFEEFADRESIKGEIVICIDSHGKEKSSDMESVNKLAKYLSEVGLKTGEVSSALTHVFEISKNDAYKIALDAKE